ncbi:Uncharacterized protein OS=Singulisphaera acidiphila (strain ATCC BAA-1392 / DSM 18658 / VKM B-2454 / MOB10) GN=Sinac_5817 PE=4 SV=1 [Gemmata massiliana]|uniref:Uncharacterized protein n=1 Tax=Gemmata massiliana TaxID=1210884 RepID=A0A6P2DBS7_9BACT|nr:hypothetical protein [Gemmata massiliana]VTR97714.1 Uncharacterized protein OS=Singulisphaera acidiphila (strain ATCC BAA-1392 / DSM 18658 / VKM B-2454 / MOB10) GN=Sinac_5817 PE=4 SV=1 [Gemmata massiliana]
MPGSPRLNSLILGQLSRVFPFRERRDGFGDARSLESDASRERVVAARYQEVKTGTAGGSSRTLRATRAALTNRGRSARIALGIGFGLFAVLTGALTIASETVKPELRDPEYAYRLKHVQKWQAERPERPLVLVLGSSRAQMGVSPAAMNFPDEPGAPVVYNFGYRAAPPLVSWLTLARALDDGVKPRAVLLFVGQAETVTGGPAEVQAWPRRDGLSGADLRRLAPYEAGGTELRRALRTARINPWSVRWDAIVGEVAPDMRAGSVKFESRSWEEMDSFGFVRFPVEHLWETKREILRENARAQARVTNRKDISDVSDRAIRDLVARCRMEGITVAVVWAPESPWLRGLYCPCAHGRVEYYTQTLVDEVGVTVFPAPTHFAEEDFVDGYHLTPDGAAKYSRWFADTHLRPWLAKARE